jgi:hypothetical protein
VPERYDLEARERITDMRRRAFRCEGDGRVAHGGTLRDETLTDGS